MKIFDLTLTLEPDIPCFAAWHPPFTIEARGTLEKVGRNTKKISFGSHTGTHMDAPLHFVDGGTSIDQIDIGLLYGDVTVVDFRTMSDLDTPRAVERSDLAVVEIAERMLFLFGWDKHWKTDTYYKGYPYFSMDAARCLVEGGVKLLLMDTPSPDDSRAILHSDKDSIIHKEFLSNGVVLVEYIKGPDQINTNARYSIVSLPLKIAGSDGSPVRVVLIEE